MQHPLLARLGDACSMVMSSVLMIKPRSIAEVASGQSVPGVAACAQVEGGEHETLEDNSKEGRLC